MIVLDTSVVLKWLLPEEESAEAEALLARHRHGTEHIIAPTLLHYEVGNALRYKHVVSDADVSHLLRILEEIGLTTLHPSTSEMAETILYAREKDISVYDASYITLARRLGCLCVTADKKLYHLIAEPFVQVIE
jgi:predicted nucleic acid-binding protein